MWTSSRIFHDWNQLLPHLCKFSKIKVNWNLLVLEHILQHFFKILAYLWKFSREIARLLWYNIGKETLFAIYLQRTLKEYWISLENLTCSSFAWLNETTRRINELVRGHWSAVKWHGIVRRNDFQRSLLERTTYQRLLAQQRRLAVTNMVLWNLDPSPISHISLCDIRKALA